MKKKTLPKFKNIDKEDSFWQEHDSADYIDWNKGKAAIFPSLKPSVITISLRLPATLLNEIRTIANKEDVPYQSLIKIMLAQEVSLLRGQRKHSL